MLDDPSELTEDLDTLYLSESNFEVEPSQILRETADQHKVGVKITPSQAKSNQLGARGVSQLFSAVCYDGETSKSSLILALTTP